MSETIPVWNVKALDMSCYVRAASEADALVAALRQNEFDPEDETEGWTVERIPELDDSLTVTRLVSLNRMLLNCPWCSEPIRRDEASFTEWETCKERDIDDCEADDYAYLAPNGLVYCEPGCYQSFVADGWKAEKTIAEEGKEIDGICLYADY